MSQRARNRSSNQVANIKNDHDLLPNVINSRTPAFECSYGSNRDVQGLIND